MSMDNFAVFMVPSHLKHFIAFSLGFSIIYFIFLLFKNRYCYENSTDFYVQEVF